MNSSLTAAPNIDDTQISVALPDALAFRKTHRLMPNQSVPAALVWVAAVDHGSKFVAVSVKQMRRNSMQKLSQQHARFAAACPRAREERAELNVALLSHRDVGYGVIFSCELVSAGNH